MLPPPGCYKGPNRAGTVNTGLFMCGRAGKHHERLYLPLLQALSKPSPIASPHSRFISLGSLPSLSSLHKHPLDGTEGVCNCQKSRVESRAIVAAANLVCLRRGRSLPTGEPEVAGGNH